MNKQSFISRLIPFIFLVIFALFCIIMLAFPTLYASRDISKSLYPDSDSGFVWLTFNSNISYGSDWRSFSPLLGSISILQLMFGLTACVLVVFNFLVKNSKKLNLVVVIVGLASMTLYAAEGIVYKNIYCDIMNYKSSYFSTASFVPLIIGIILVLGYFITSATLSNINAKNDEITEISIDSNKITESGPTAVNSASENDKIVLLAQYKELYDKGIITEEEFDSKKKQLLGL